MMKTLYLPTKMLITVRIVVVHRFEAEQAALCPLLMLKWYTRC